jgi:TATA-binding protein-associated factor
MVAPVRESCAQALGTVIKYMRASSVLLVLDNLLKLGERVQWEVRHVGLLGIVSMSEKGGEA